MPFEKPIAPEDKDRTMHVALKNNEENTNVAYREIPQVVFGQNICLFVNTESKH